jgi:hypothetical protein
MVERGANDVERDVPQRSPDLVRIRKRLAAPKQSAKEEEIPHPVAMDGEGPERKERESADH